MNGSPERSPAQVGPWLQAARLPRTYLFVPADRPERFDKALQAGADAVVIDLEDAVASDRKDAARAQLAAWLAAHPGPGDRERLVLRINDGGTPWHAADLELAAANRWQAVMLPKSEHADQIEALYAALGAGTPVMPLVESARGVLAVESIAAAAGVARIAFGTLDYAIDLDLSGDERGLIEPSARIAQASRAAGIGSPVAGVTPDIQDESRLLADFAFARAFGFGAKLCIHPRQVAPLHGALMPAPEALDWARRVLAAASASGGAAVQLDGRMVDRPVILRAQRLLAAAGGHGG